MQPYFLNGSLLEKIDFHYVRAPESAFHVRPSRLPQAAVYKGRCLFAFIRLKVTDRRLAIKQDADRSGDVLPRVRCKLASQL